MTKKKKTLTETHGKVETSQPTTLEQIWGFNELAKYGTSDENLYQSKLAEMNRTDLESHARNLGIVIVESTERLRGNLLKEFRNYNLSLRKPVAQVNVPSEPSAEVKRILAEGR